MINPKLQTRAPQLARFLREFRLPISDIQSMNGELNKGKPLAEITAGWIAAHRPQIAGWVKTAQA